MSLLAQKNLKFAEPVMTEIPVLVPVKIVSNIAEYNDLLDELKQDIAEMQTTLNKINNFEIKFSVKGE